MWEGPCCQALLYVSGATTNETILTKELTNFFVLVVSIIRLPFTARGCLGEEGEHYETYWQP